MVATIDKLYKIRNFMIIKHKRKCNNYNNTMIFSKVKIF